MIVGAAIKKDDVLYIGSCHCNILFEHIEENLSECVQGFVNDKGIFLTRKEAELEALECGQLKRDELRGNLISSDVIYKG